MRSAQESNRNKSSVGGSQVLLALITSIQAREGSGEVKPAEDTSSWRSAVLKGAEKWDRLGHWTKTILVGILHTLDLSP